MASVGFGTYIYLFDRFHPVEMPLSKIAQAFEEDPLKPFALLRELVEEKTGGVKSVRFYGSYFNPSKQTAVLEYFVEVDEGTVGVKIVHADNPSRALMEYYKAERLKP